MGFLRQSFFPFNALGIPLINNSEIELNWLCYLAGKFETPLSIFLTSLGMKPFRPMPSHFCHILL